MSGFSLILCIFGIFLLILIYFLFGKNKSLIHPINIFIITTVFQFYIKAFWVSYGNPLVPLSLDIDKSIFFIFLTNFFFLFFYYFFDSKKLPILTLEPTDIKFGNNTAIKFILLASAMNLSLAFLNGGNPLYGLINPIEFRIFMQKNGMYYIEFLIFSFLISGVALSFNSYYNKKISFYKFFILFIFSAVIALNSGLRGRFIEILIIPIVIYGLYNNKLPRFFLALIAFIIIPFATLFGIYRDSVRGNSLSLEEIIYLLSDSLSSDNKLLPLFLHRFDAFDNFVNVINNPPSFFNYGYSIIGVLAQPIPRFIWPDKPHNFTSEMTLSFRPDLFSEGIALTYSSYSEAYLNFGFIIGPIFLSLFLAIAIKILDNLSISASKNSTSLLIFVLLYQLPFVILSAGFINDVSTVFILLTIAFVLFLRISKSLKII